MSKTMENGWNRGTKTRGVGNDLVKASTRPEPKPGCRARNQHRRAQVRVPLRSNPLHGDMRRPARQVMTSQKTVRGLPGTFLHSGPPQPEAASAS